MTDLGKKNKEQDHRKKGKRVTEYTKQIIHPSHKRLTLVKSLRERERERERERKERYDDNYSYQSA